MADPYIPNRVLSRLVGSRLYAVEFVLNDYIQFRFDEPSTADHVVTLNAYVWPAVKFGGHVWREDDLGYADAIRRLTPGTVVATTEEAGHGIGIELDTGSLAVDPAAGECNLEIAEIAGWSDGASMVWRAGELTFADLREPK